MARKPPKPPPKPGKCGTCGGSGRQYAYVDGAWVPVICTSCKGTGRGVTA